MLPRRHILDLFIYGEDREDILSMSALSLSIDALKYIDPAEKKDHLVEALEFNEFICYVFPERRPKNRALLLHIVSDLIGLLAYGVHRKSRKELLSLETVNYSEKKLEDYALPEVWNRMKEKIYKKKHGPMSIIDGFLRKIRIEMDIIERYPNVEEIFKESKKRISEWVIPFMRFYDKRKDEILSAYERWFFLWNVGKRKEDILSGMVERLYDQAVRDFGVKIDKKDTFDSIIKEKNKNRLENEKFTGWFCESIKILFNT